MFYKCATRLEAFFESKVAAGITWKASRGSVSGYLNRD
jgi:histone acetyltransferase